MAKTCTHHFVCGEPVGKVVPGRCKHCGAEREFSAVVNEVFNRKTTDIEYGPGLSYATALAREGF